MSKFVRKLQNRRWTGVGAVLGAIAEAVGLVTTLAEKTEWYVPLAAFVVFVVLVILHVLSLHNEIEEKDEALANRKQRRWIREQLSKYGDEYKAIMDGDDLKATLAIDERFRAFCDTNEELAGYWSVMNSGAHLPVKTIPEWIKTDAQKRVWHKCQTRRYNIANVIKEFRD